MLFNKIDSTGFSFKASINGIIIPCAQWQETDDCIYYLPLSMLADNGNAIVNEYNIIVPFDCIYLLSDFDKKLLGIPSYYTKGLRLRGDGMLNEQDFKYQLELVTSLPNGNLIPFQRTGNVVECGNERYLLTEPQYKLFELIEDFNATDCEQKNLSFNLRHFAVIKEQAKACGCLLDSYLENENVYAPETIKLSVSKEEDGMKVLPSLNVAQNDSFQNVFEHSRRMMPVYPVQNGTFKTTQMQISDERGDKKRYRTSN